MRKFKINELARIKKDCTVEPGNPDHRGKTCIIFGYRPGICDCGCGTPAYIVECEGGLYHADEDSLQKLLPDSDSYHRGSWDEFHRIVNQPTGVTNLE